jgi:hypothetical protein
LEIESVFSPSVYGHKETIIAWQAAFVPKIFIRYYPVSTPQIATVNLVLQLDLTWLA